ncbi:MAG TPA: hypothetical protein VF781_15880 [Solirubrobacteraceae bacterium]
MNKNTPTAPEHVTIALDHARRLTGARPEAADQLSWTAQAAHVGDLSVLALALSNR